jgi:hypothetical protein
MAAMLYWLLLPLRKLKLPPLLKPLKLLLPLLKLLLKNPLLLQKRVLQKLNNMLLPTDSIPVLNRDFFCSGLLFCFAVYGLLL